MADDGFRRDVYRADRGAFTANSRARTDTRPHQPRRACSLIDRRHRLALDLAVTTTPRKPTDQVAELSLSEASSQLLNECRMVLPGIQTLLGFQLIAVFQPPFAGLPAGEQRLHLAAVLCVVLGIALVMTPAALHRLREPESVSRRFIRISSSLLMWSMPPLAVGLACDIYLVARIITGQRVESALLAGVALVIFGGLWFLLPSRARLE